MAVTRKQIAFDLDTKALEKYYPTNNWRKAYADIKAFMSKNDFSWQQGSVYVSDRPITSTRVTSVLRELAKEYKWLNVCMRDCRETSIGKQQDRNHIFDKSVDVPERNKENTKAKTVSQISKE